jgi:DNA-nicking Smr family endonuclease
MIETDAVELPIDGELDLHTFSPREIGELIPAYLEECRRRGIFEVRIVHGKGTGNLRRSVHAILARLPEVANFRGGDETSGSWGATLVQLQIIAPLTGESWSK